MIKSTGVEVLDEELLEVTDAVNCDEETLHSVLMA